MPQNLRAEYDRMLQQDRRMAEQMQRVERQNRDRRRQDEERRGRPQVVAHGNHGMQEGPNINILRQILQEHAADGDVDLDQMRQLI